MKSPAIAPCRFEPNRLEDLQRAEIAAAIECDDLADISRAVARATPRSVALPKKCPGTIQSQLGRQPVFEVSRLTLPEVSKPTTSAVPAPRS